MHKPQDEINRFFSFVRKTDTCWLWYGGSETRYGQYDALDGRHYKAHRFSWEIHNGPLSDYQIVRHRCDVRNCVNPKHLSLGTIKDNNRDMHKRGRNYGGYAQQMMKLNEEQTTAILRSIDKGIPAKILAKKYGLTTRTVNEMKITRESLTSKERFTQKHQMRKHNPYYETLLHHVDSL